MREGVPSPRGFYYMAEGRPNLWGETPYWNDVTVKTILRNEVYLGHMVRNKTGSFIAKAKRYTNITEPSGRRRPCRPSRSAAATLALSAGTFHKTEKAPGRKSQRDSCRGASSSRRYPCQGEAKAPGPFGHTSRFSYLMLKNALWPR